MSYENFTREELLAALEDQNRFGGAVADGLFSLIALASNSSRADLGLRILAESAFDLLGNAPNHVCFEVRCGDEALTVTVRRCNGQTIEEAYLKVCQERDKLTAEREAGGKP
jgi:hypothetical protein